MLRFAVGGLILLLAVGQACRPSENIGPLSPNLSQGRLDSIPYNPTAYSLPTINGLPPMEMPDDNPLTVQGIKLGRLLFYDPMLSRDSTMSCASCHNIRKAFTDGRPTAVGIRGIASNRNSMSLINVGYNWNRSRQHNFNWDGKFYNLEDQVLAPVEHPLEMDANWDSIEARLRRHPEYPRLFRQAFGIGDRAQVTRHLAAKAMAQFLRTLNSANSMYDQHEWVPFVYMTDQQLRGFQLFLGDAAGNPNGKDAECAHCHSFSRNRAIFARNNFSNNGLDSAASLTDFVDLGLGAVTGRASDNGRFREVSLRNVALTAPYMHDGRFNTLEEVMDHYVMGLHPAPNLANELASAPDLPRLTQQEKQDVIAFLHALTDTSYFNRTEWMNPFVVEPNPWQ